MNTLADHPELLRLATQHRSSPLGKTRYTTRQEAQTRLDQLTEHMHVYRCAICDGYHFGHRRGQVG